MPLSRDSPISPFSSIRRIHLSTWCSSSCRAGTPSPTAHPSDAATCALRISIFPYSQKPFVYSVFTRTTSSHFSPQVNSKDDRTKGSKIKNCGLWGSRLGVKVSQLPPVGNDNSMYCDGSIRTLYLWRVEFVGFVILWVRRIVPTHNAAIHFRGRENRAPHFGHCGSSNLPPALPPNRAPRIMPGTVPAIAPKGPPTRPILAPSAAPAAAPPAPPTTLPAEDDSCPKQNPQEGQKTTGVSFLGAGSAVARLNLSSARYFARASTKARGDESSE